jgi:hypothetical protein
MPSSRSDFILRLIEEIGAALRRLRGRLAGGAPATAVVAGAREAQATLLGSMWPVLQTVDAATAAALVRDPWRLELWSDLLLVEAEAHRTLGDEPRAQALEKQAALLAAYAGEAPGGGGG